MTTTPKSFVEAKQALSQITADTVAHNSTVDQSIERIIASHAQLNDMSGKWRSTIEYINSAAAANPDDTTLAAMKLEADKIVADFIAMRTRAAAIRDAAVAAK